MTSARATMMMAIVASIGALSLSAARAPVSEQAKVPASEPALEIAWHVALSTRDVSGVAATNSTAFVTTSESTSAYSALDGTPIWSKTPGSEVSPVIVGQNVAIITQAGVHVLRPDGMPAWYAEVADVAHAVPAGSDLILVSGRAVARWSAGKERWRLTLNGDPATAPVIHNDNLFVGVKPAAVDVIDPIKGEILAFLHLTAGPDSLGAAPERLMVCTSEGNSAGALSAYKTVRPRGLDWTYPLIRCIGGPASDDQRTYASFMDNTVRAFDTGSGHQKWTGRLPTRPLGGPIRFPNSIVVPLSTGSLFEFALDGKQISPDTRPASLPNLFRMFAAAASPDRTRVFATGATGELAGSRLVFAWARPSTQKAK